MAQRIIFIKIAPYEQIKFKQIIHQRPLPDKIILLGKQWKQKLTNA